jgi:hypothetical protein
MNGLSIFQRLSIALFKGAKRGIFTRALGRTVPVNLHPPLEADAIHFRHSGLIGDIIYAIPAMLALAEGRRIHLHLHINQKALYGKKMRHYNQGKILTEKSVEWLAPLLLSQPAFAVCDRFEGQRVDYDLDDFRRYPFDYNTGHICRWYFLTYGITADLSQPWLQVEPDLSFRDAIVISRSFRYRAPGISYAFLRKYPRLVFLGLPEEYEDLRSELPGLTYQPVPDFLAFARIVAGSRCFIGNQSFPFAVAEGLKTPRALETFFECPNVIPEGPDAYDFCYQPQFEKVVAQLCSR